MNVGVEMVSRLGQYRWVFMSFFLQRYLRTQNTPTGDKCVVSHLRYRCPPATTDWQQCLDEEACSNEEHPKFTESTEGELMVMATVATKAQTHSLTSKMLPFGECKHEMGALMSAVGVYDDECVHLCVHSLSSRSLALMTLIQQPPPPPSLSLFLSIHLAQQVVAVDDRCGSGTTHHYSPLSTTQLNGEHDNNFTVRMRMVFGHVPGYYPPGYLAPPE